MCVTFVVFTDCESCTRPISTNPRSMESGEYELTRGTCSTAYRLELHAVAGLLWNSWCVLGGAEFSVIFFFVFFFFERPRPAASMRPPCLIYLSTSNEVRPRERSVRGCFFPLGQKRLFIQGCVQGAIIKFVCRYVCVTFVVFTDCESCTRPIFTKLRIYGSGRV